MILIRVLCVVILVMVQSALSMAQSSEASVKTKADRDYILQVKQNMVPLHSLESDDFSDLEFLKEKLQDKRIVFLGESNHSVETYNQMKFRLIKFLHRELNFNTLAFEGNIQNCIITNELFDSLNSFYVMTHSILGAWRTPVMAEIFDYMQSNYINFTGFDPNLNSSLLSRSQYKMLFNENESLANDLFEADTTIWAYHHKRYRYFMATDQDTVLEMELDSIRENLKHVYLSLKSRIETERDSENKYLLIKKILDNKMEILKCPNDYEIHIDRKVITSDNRERIMARNLSFLIDSVYQDEKIIVWCHNLHASKGSTTYVEQPTDYINNAIGRQISERYRGKSYHIALFGFPGAVGRGGDTQVTVLKKAKKNSLEAVLNHSPHRFGFLEMNDRLSFLDKPILMRNYTYGTYVYSTIMNDCYDALIFLRDIEPAVLISDRENEYYLDKYR